MARNTIPTFSGDTKKTYLERQVSYFLGNFTPKTSNYCHEK